MLQKRLLYLAVFINLLVSCSTNNEQTAANDATQAYQDFKRFIAEVEQETEVNEATAAEEWEEEAGRLRTTYLEHESRVQEHLDRYTPEQREEINDLQERFDVAFQRLQKQYDDASRRYRLRQDMLGVEVAADDLSRVTPDNLAATYQKFVNTLARNQEVYTDRDWEMIEGWWSALNHRKEQLSGALKPADREAIAKKEQEYRQIRAEAL